MKKITLISAMLFIVVSLFAQTPQAFKYQTVVRDNAGEILANQNVSLRMTILQGALPGTVVYAETHTATTNEFGLVTLEIGRGTPITGSFSTINWATSPSYLKTELDPAGGTTYLIMGTSELLSVPYSLISRTSTEGWNVKGNSGTNPSTNFIGTIDSISLNIKVNNNKSAWIDINAKNTSLGYKSLLANTTGYDNSSLGAFTLTKNLGGYGNTAAGYGALYLNTSGYYNTAGGFAALNSNQGGHSNTAFGVSALQNSSTGFQNTAVGMQSLNSNTGGNENTAIGHSSLWSNLMGTSNTAVGFCALRSNTAGNSNIAIGYKAGYNETGSNKLYIDNSETSTPLIYGDFSTDILTLNGRVGIGTTPDAIAKLHVYNSSSATNVTFGGTATGQTFMNIGTSANTNGYSMIQSVKANGSAWGDLILNPSGGNVGIGSTSPNHKFEIGNSALGNTAGNTVAWMKLFGGSANTDQLKFTHRRHENGSDWRSGEIRIQKAVDATDMNFISFKGTSPAVGCLAFGYGNTEHMLINSGGDVGIGTSSPTSKLDIIGVTRIRGGGYLAIDAHNSTTDNYGYISSAGMTAGTGLKFETTNGTGVNGAVRMTVKNDGNVGIGNSDPQTKLHISATSNPLRLDGLQTTTYDNYLVVDANGVVSKRTGTGGGASGWALTGNTLAGTEKFGSINNYPVKFYTNNTERFRISETGNVGIGTSSPLCLLHLYGTIPVQRIEYPGESHLTFACRPDGETEIDYSVGFGNAGLTFRNGFGTSIMKLTGSGNVILASNYGNVGIGTDSPASKLDVRGKLTIRDASTGNVFMVAEEGNVGIGTESPTSKLDIRGNLTIREASTGTIAVELGTGLDYAEGFNISDEITVQPGTVLCIDPENEGELRISTEAYDYRVAGIIAGANGLGSGIKLGSGEFDYDVALAGRVYCNVITTNDEITAGDLLTTSDVPGYAMKVRDFDKAKGAILGKAMESLKKNSKGQILVLVTLQ